MVRLGSRCLHSPLIRIGATLGALAALVLVPAAQAQTQAPALGPGDLEASWLLLGTADGGRQLVVGNLNNVSLCRSLRVDLLGLDADSVGVRVVHAVNPGTPAPYVCGTLDVGDGVEVRRVDLGEPIGGRPVIGPRRKNLLKFRGSFGYIIGPPVRSVVGLSLHDARSVLRGTGIWPSHLSVRGPRDGEVVRVTPPLPKRLVRSRPVTIITRERGN